MDERDPYPQEGVRGARGLCEPGPARARGAGPRRRARAARPPQHLENVLPYFAVGAVYAASGPSALGAWLCYGGFTVARVLHTLFYLNERMPHRTLAYALGYFAMLWMILSSAFELLVA